jgi:hypothetical protein
MFINAAIKEMIRKSPSPNPGALPPATLRLCPDHHLLELLRHLLSEIEFISENSLAQE